ncbi:MAG: hypothetical protein K2N28_01745 [Muribaculaceae bacterium]|nr:hypothetical protein [Muribaculaceae bacterium]
MTNDPTSTLLAALRILKAAFYLQFIHYHITIDDFDEWMNKRDRIIIEICYDIYDKIIVPSLEDYKQGMLFREEQRMLAKAIKIIAENVDFCPRPWDWSVDTSQIPPKTVLEFLNKCRDSIRSYIEALKITDIAGFKDIAGDLIKMLSPDSQFLDNRILLKILHPIVDSYEGVEVYEMEIIGENDRIEVSPNVFGSFGFLLESKKVNIETGQILNKVKYDLYNYTIDIDDIIDNNNTID